MGFEPTPIGQLVKGEENGVEEKKARKYSTLSPNYYFYTLLCTKEARATKKIFGCMTYGEARRY